MIIYSKLKLESIDDLYENEFGLPILTSNIPDELIEYSGIDCKSYIEESLKKNCSLLLKVPSFPRIKELKNAEILKSNSISMLYRIQKNIYGDGIWKFLNENEYANGYDFFLLKSIVDIDFLIPNSSMERIKVSNITSNKIVVLRLENNEMTELTWK